MELASQDPNNVDRAISLWRGFLKTKESNPELALIFCKGALLSLNQRRERVEGTVA